MRSLGLLLTVCVLGAFGVPCPNPYDQYGYISTGCNFPNTPSGTICIPTGCAGGLIGSPGGLVVCQNGQYEGMFNGCVTGAQTCDTPYGQAGFLISTNCIQVPVPSGTQCYATCAPYYAGIAAGVVVCDAGRWSGSFIGCDQQVIPTYPLFNIPLPLPPAAPLPPRPPYYNPPSQSKKGLLGLLGILAIIPLSVCAICILILFCAGWCRTRKGGRIVAFNTPFTSFPTIEYAPPVIPVVDASPSPSPSPLSPAVGYSGARTLSEFNSPYGRSVSPSRSGGVNTVYIGPNGEQSGVSSRQTAAATQLAGGGTAIASGGNDIASTTLLRNADGTTSVVVVPAKRAFWKRSKKLPPIQVEVPGPNGTTQVRTLQIEKDGQVAVVGTASAGAPAAGPAPVGSAMVQSRPMTNPAPLRLSNGQPVSFTGTADLTVKGAKSGGKQASPRAGGPMGKTAGGLDLATLGALIQLGAFEGAAAAGGGGYATPFVATSVADVPGSSPQGGLVGGMTAAMNTTTATALGGNMASPLGTLPPPTPSLSPSPTASPPPSAFGLMGMGGAPAGGVMNPYAMSNITPSSPPPLSPGSLGLSPSLSPHTNIHQLQSNILRSAGGGPMGLGSMAGSMSPQAPPRGPSLSTSPPLNPYSSPGSPSASSPQPANAAAQKPLKFSGPGVRSGVQHSDAADGTPAYMLLL